MGNEAASLHALLGGIAWPTGAPPIAVQPLPWTAAPEKLLTGFARGSLPSVGQVGTSWITALAARGPLAQVPDYPNRPLPAQCGAVETRRPTCGARGYQSV